MNYAPRSKRKKSAGNSINDCWLAKLYTWSITRRFKREVPSRQRITGSRARSDLHRKFSRTEYIHLIHILILDLSNAFIQNKSNLYLLSAVFIAQVLVGPSKKLKEIIQTEHNRPETNRLSTNQLAIYIASVAEDLNSELPWNKSR